jgi:hypothetical protein
VTCIRSPFSPRSLGYISYLKKKRAGLSWWPCLRDIHCDGGSGLAGRVCSLDIVFSFPIRQLQSNTPEKITKEKMRFRLLDVWGLVVAILVLATFGWAQTQSNVIVVKATRQAFAPPLSQMVPTPPRSDGQSSLPDDDDRQARHQARATGQARDSVLQESADTAVSTALSTLSTNPGLNFLGMGSGFSGYSEQAIVPDTNGAAGPTQFVQYINESFVVFNKSNGAVAYGPADGNTLFQALGGQCAANDNLDPIVQFDKLANRWVIMMPMFAAPFQLCVAVSTTSDATNGGWNLYAFPTSGVFPDYPKLAIWPDGYYVTYDRGLSSGYGGSAACALDRNSMLAGAAATMQCFTPGTSYGAMLPADVDGTTPPPVGSPEYFLSYDYNDESLDLWQFQVNWTTPADTTFTGPTNIPVAAFTEPCGETVTEILYTTGACIPQEGTTQRLDSYGDRVMYRLAYRNFGSYASLVANHTVSTGASSSSNTGIRWYELQNSGSGFGLYQQGTYAPDSNYRWMGSIAMDKLGDIALGYSVSSGTMSPSIRYTGRLATDPLDQMEGEIDILSAAGVTSGSQSASDYRWGDYSSMAIDSTDDCTFWYTTEYQPTKGVHWSTRIVSFSFPACAGGFTLSSSPSSLTVNSGNRSTVTLTVMPQGGFNSTVSFSCSGLPAGATCTFNPPQVTPSGGAITTQLTVSVGAQSSSRRMPNPFFPVAAMAAAFCMIGWRRGRHSLMPMLAAALIGLGAMSACGSGGSTGGGSTPVTSTVTVTATAGNIQQTTTITLTVN